MNTRAELTLHGESGVYALLRVACIGQGQWYGFQRSVCWSFDTLEYLFYFRYTTKPTLHRVDAKVLKYIPELPSRITRSTGKSTLQPETQREIVNPILPSSLNAIKGNQTNVETCRNENVRNDIQRTIH